MLRIILTLNLYLFLQRRKNKSTKGQRRLALGLIGQDAFFISKPHFNGEM